MEEENKSTIEKINSIYNKLFNESAIGIKKKDFKFPFIIRLFKGSFRKGNKIVVQTISNTGAVQFKIRNIDDSTIKIGENIHDASANYILRYKRYPLIIIPEWNIKPFSPSDNMTTATTEGTLTAAEKLILTKMKLEAVKPKMNLNFKMILLIIAIGGGILLLLNYLKII